MTRPFIINFAAVTAMVAVFFWCLSLAPTRAAECAGVRGTASFYCCEHHGRRTASREIFDQNAMTAAHRSLPFGTRLLVRNVQNGKTVQIRVNDRGPAAWTGRKLDLSIGAFKRLAHPDRGVIAVCLELVR